MKYFEHNEAQIRPPARADAPGLVELINMCSVAEGGQPDFTLAGLLEDWDDPNFALATDAWVAEGPGGNLLGYEQVFLNATGMAHELDGYVHPAHRGRGIGTRLLRLAERRVAAAPARAPIHGTIEADNMPAQQLFAAEGYRCVRHFWRMEAELIAAPPAPEWPASIRVRAFVPGQDERATYAAIEEAFLDHWNHTPASYDDWVGGQLRRADFDPALWFLAYDGDEIAGTALCFPRTAQLGWVRGLGVRRPWRGRGLGMALLRHAFGAFYARGARAVGLGVDAQSPTGATRLYERAGMRVTERYDTMEKVLGL